jgi:hypothetical protein
MCAKGTNVHMCVKPDKKQKSQVKYHTLISTNTTGMPQLKIIYTNLGLKVNNSIEYLPLRSEWLTIGTSALIKESPYLGHSDLTRFI